MRGEHQTSSNLSAPFGGSSPHARGALPEPAQGALCLGIIPACAGSTRARPRRSRVRRDHPRMRGEHRWPRRPSLQPPGSSPHARGALDLHLRHRRLAGIIPACAGSTRWASAGTAAPRDHPRMRGEHLPAAHRLVRLRGSSPHARGALSSRPERSPSARIIPAYAGSTGSGSGGWRRRRDHPRMRGEHGGWRCRFPSAPGSSPHARGAPRQGGPDAEHRGIIPACAGSTRCRWPARRSCRDHPRMRGEHRRGASDMAAKLGSSPHARGAQAGTVAELATPGIIPACAGSTHSRAWRMRTRGDHPRMRGEHAIFASSCSYAMGSSPHARGARTSVSEKNGGGRIIPACAGSTSSRPWRRRGWGDHPRMRGEHSVLDLTVPTQPGSSPHARGAPVLVEDGRLVVGIIPACAGSTTRHPQARCRCRDHPRMRGEHLGPEVEVAYGEGSSPHARGALLDGSLVALGDGIIPACAGSTSCRSSRATT